MKVWIVAALCLLAGGASAGERVVLVQSTTSTQNSGLYETILPAFEAATGIAARVVSVGTGQALRNAANCDGDVLIVHAREAEDAFVAAGYGVARHDLMYNDFVIVGPGDDPVGIGGVADVAAAMTRLSSGDHPFISRGDDSGTHSAERKLWLSAGIDPSAGSGQWYRETGSGMGATLNMAVSTGAYTLTDRATWLSFGNRGNHRVLLAGDPDLFNQYGVIRVDPEHCPNARSNAAERFVEWLLSPAGQNAIAGHRIRGEQLFFPNAAAR